MSNPRLKLSRHLIILVIIKSEKCVDCENLKVTNYVRRCNIKLTFINKTVNCL